MHILDLPPDIFSHTVYLLICNVGLVKAARARSTCKAFAQTIDDDICGRQSIKNFKDIPSFSRQHLLCRLPLNILDKLSRKRCRDDYLPTHMDAIINTLVSFDEHGTIIKPDVYKAQMCNAIAASLNKDGVLAYLLEGPCENSVKVRENMGRADTLGMVAAAAVVGNEAALLFFADKVRSTLTSRELYGTPLLAAAVNRQARAASIIFRRIESEVTKIEAREHLWSTIATCMTIQRVAMLPTLLTWYYRLDPSPMDVSSTKETMTSWAMRSGNIDALRICYDPIIDPRHGVKTCIVWLREVCKYGHAVIIRFLLFEAPPPRFKPWTVSQRLALSLQSAATYG